jgi:hypothetical protein
VIEDDRVPGEVEIGSEHHAPRVGRRDGRPRGAGEIRATVRRPRLVVEDAADAESRDDGTVNRHDERSAPFWCGRQRAEHAAELGALTRDARFGAWAG